MNLARIVTVINRADDDVSEGFQTFTIEICDVSASLQILKGYGGLNRRLSWKFTDLKLPDFEPEIKMINHNLSSFILQI